MPEINAVGDLVLTRAVEFRALADPLALRLTDRLRPSTVVTSSALAAETGSSAAEVDACLARLEAAEIVRRDGDGWTGVAKGIVFEIPDEPPEAQAAARALTATMLLQYAAVPRQWVEVTEPGLDVAWARAAGLFNAGVRLTADELRRVQEDLEALLAPYLTRSADDAPADARRVRLLAYFLPDATG
ncbi:MAG TPA: hypothetical protein VFJ60_04325 [Gaiella sp.]|nr:hypothetical protein [Gaiella sp.]